MELQDMDVERVDLVKRPATRRKFLMLKNEVGTVTGGRAALRRETTQAIDTAAAEEAAGMPEVEDEPDAQGVEKAVAPEQMAEFVSRVTAFMNSLDPSNLNEAQMAKAQAVVAMIDGTAASEEAGPTLAEEAVDVPVETRSETQDIAAAVKQAVTEAMQPLTKFLRSMPAPVVRSVQRRAPVASRQQRLVAGPTRPQAPPQMGSGLFSGIFTPAGAGQMPANRRFQ
jgi:hypothetical protein